MKQLDENALSIYVDGSSYTSPRIGGVGLRFIWIDEHGNEQINEESPLAWKGGTNNQMELQACIEALKIATGRRAPFALSRFEKIVFYTDSQYVSENFNKAKFVWPKNRWKTRDGPPVANTSQWKELMKLVRSATMRVDVHWVKGHGKDSHNRRVDKLAKQSARTPSKRTLKHQRVRRKKSPYEVERGSVRMEGQIATVHITFDEWLPSPHRCYCYRYEVMNEDSPFYLRRDIITSHVLLKAGHTYVVRFNDDTRNPRIDEMLSEILNSD